MSLKRYLFLLIALFLLLLAAVQIFFIQSVQRQVQEEISNKSQTLSEVAFKAMEHRLQPELKSENLKPGISIRIEEAPGEKVDLGDGLYFIAGKGSHKVTVTAEKPPMVEQALQVVRKLPQIQLLQQDKTLNNAFSVQLDTPGTQFVSQHIVQFDQDTSSVGKSFESLMLLTATLTITGIVFAFLLARHISEPLSQLASGFNRLAGGKLGSHLKPNGVKEVKETLEQFNVMSDRLVQMQEMENQIQQQQQLAEIGEVARGLAHTLRNPLNTIGLSMEQMSQSETTQEQRQALAEAARKKIQHMDRSIKHLLNLANSHVSRHQQVNLQQVIQDIILELSLNYPAAIDYHVPETLHINASETEIRTMIHVLLSNAVEADKEGKPIHISAKENDDLVIIEVKDQGPGLDNEIIPNLFKPHITNKAEGAGMGLFIVKRLCQSFYQGSINLVNHPDGGCMATLKLHNAIPTSEK